MCVAAFITSAGSAPASNASDAAPARESMFQTSSGQPAARAIFRNVRGKCDLIQGLPVRSSTTTGPGQRAGRVAIKSG